MLTIHTIAHMCNYIARYMTNPSSGLQSNMMVAEQLSNEQAIHHVHLLNV